MGTKPIGVNKEEHKTEKLPNWDVAQAMNNLIDAWVDYNSACEEYINNLAKTSKIEA